MRARLGILVLIGVSCFSSMGLADMVQYRHRVTDANGNELSRLQVGDTFYLNTWVEHAHTFAAPDEIGVFTAFVDVEFDPAMASVVGDITYGPLFQNYKRGDISTAGRIDDLGAMASNNEGLDPLGTGEFLVSSVPMMATSAGELTFLASDSGNLIQYPTLVYGFDHLIDPSDIDHGAVSVIVAVPEPKAITSLALLFASCYFVQRVRRV